MLDARPFADQNAAHAGPHAFRPFCHARAEIERPQHLPSPVSVSPSSDSLYSPARAASRSATPATTRAWMQRRRKFGFREGRARTAGCTRRAWRARRTAGAHRWCFCARAPFAAAAGSPRPARRRWIGGSAVHVVHERCGWRLEGRMTRAPRRSEAPRGPGGPREMRGQRARARRQAVSPVLSPTLSGTHDSQSPGSSPELHTSRSPRYWMSCTTRQRRPVQS